MSQRIDEAVYNHIVKPYISLISRFYVAQEFKGNNQEYKQQGLGGLSLAEVAR
jgi:hypothetical protein